GERVLVASSAGDGFIIPEADVIAQTRSGKQILNVKDDIRATICVPVTGDHVAVVGKNRKLLIFPLEELPEMTRGKGVRLQTYRDKGAVLSDVKCLALEHGLSWKENGGRTRTETAEALREDGYVHKRAGAGRMAPRGFPRDNRFN
ncbi:MAG: DNA gyrase C-terminal beta-propeller domain-containing protein, partial [Pseudomonadota bacterium]